MKKILEKARNVTEIEIPYWFILKNYDEHRFTFFTNRSIEKVYLYCQEMGTMPSKGVKILLDSKYYTLVFEKGIYNAGQVIENESGNVSEIYRRIETIKHHEKQYKKTL